MDETNAAVNAANEEIVEINTFAGSAIASGSRIAQDASVPNILAELLQNFSKGREGFEGLFPNYRREAATSTVPQKEARKAAFSAGLSGSTLNEVTTYDLTEGIHGIQCLIEAGVRGGYEQGRADLIAKLKSGEVKIADL